MDFKEDKWSESMKWFKLAITMELKWVENRMVLGKLNDSNVLWWVAIIVTWSPSESKA